MWRLEPMVGPAWSGAKKKEGHDESCPYNFKSLIIIGLGLDFR
jgi:hypothetical protein